MRRAIIPALLLVLVSVVLGATVFREQVAHAAATLLVREQNTDANGNIKIHEQGTANVNVSSLPAVRAETATSFATFTLSAGPFESAFHSIGNTLNTSLIGISRVQGSSVDHAALARYDNGGSEVFEFDVPSAGAVIPLPQPLPIDRVGIVCEASACHATFSLAGK